MDLKHLNTDIVKGCMYVRRKQLRFIGYQHNRVLFVLDCLRLLRFWNDRFGKQVHLIVTIEMHRTVMFVRGWLLGKHRTGAHLQLSHVPRQAWISNLHWSTGKVQNWKGRRYALAKTELSPNFN